MNQGDLGSFQGIMGMAHEALKKSNANLKHIIVFSDGDPGAPSEELMRSIVGDRITVSTILISGHVGPETMIWIADQGKGRFYNVTSPDDLPQIFVKETAVILKSAIYEEPFKPQLRAGSEADPRHRRARNTRTCSGMWPPPPKPRAETPLWTDKGDPLLAHWQYGLGRAVAFTSDAKAQVGPHLDRLGQVPPVLVPDRPMEPAAARQCRFHHRSRHRERRGDPQHRCADDAGQLPEFPESSGHRGQPQRGTPNGAPRTDRPGPLRGPFPHERSRLYLLNLMELKEGQVRGSQVVGASVNYSPEFNAVAPNLNLLRRIAKGAAASCSTRPRHGLTLSSRIERKTFQPRAMWESLLKFAIILFVFDVGVRRIQIDREEWQRLVALFRARILRQAPAGPPQPEEALGTLLARRTAVRSTQPEPDASLFSPTREPVAVSAAESPTAPSASHPPPPATAAQPGPEAPADTTSRLLQAKKRAQQRRR